MHVRYRVFCFIVVGVPVGQAPPGDTEQDQMVHDHYTDHAGRNSIQKAPHRAHAGMCKGAAGAASYTREEGQTVSEIRTVSSMDGIDYLMAKLYRMPEQFRDQYKRKDYSAAKYNYDTAVRIALFMELPEEKRIELFGSREDPENPIVGLYPEYMVDKVYLECVVKRNEGLENVRKPPSAFLGYENSR